MLGDRNSAPRPDKRGHFSDTMTIPGWSGVGWGMGHRDQEENSFAVKESSFPLVLIACLLLDSSSSYTYKNWYGGGGHQLEFRKH